MALTQIQVIYGSGGLAGPDGLPGTGTITLQPLQETPSADTTIIARRVTYPISSGQIAGIYETNGQAMQALVIENVTGVRNPPPYVVSIPTSGTLDLSTASRGTSSVPTPLYILDSARGVPGGVATLDSITGLVMASQLPAAALNMFPWDIAETYSGLSNEGAVTELFNDPENAFQPDANTTYVSKRITCSELIMIDNTTTFDNCDIICTNSTFGIRTDANTGLEFGRVFRHCRITSAGVALSGGSGLTATLCDIYHCGDDAARFGRTHAQGPTLELCHIHDFRPQAGAHFDGIQQQTPPAADVRIWGCSITMALAAGWPLPEGAGTTGAVFLDGVDDNPIPDDDPEPHRIGRVIVEQTKLSVSTGNYTIVADMDGLDVSGCMLLPGSTAIASIQAGITVTGHNNIGGDGHPLSSIDIQGFPSDPRTLARQQDVDMGTPPTDGQALIYDATSKTWKPGTVSGGGGFTPVINKVRFTSGDIAFPNTSGAFVPIQQIGGALIEAAVAASVGHWTELTITDLRTTGSSALLDVGIIVGSSVVRWLSSDTATPAGDGLVSFYSDPANFSGHGDLVGFTVTSNDLDAGNVRFVLAVNSNGTQTLKCSAGNPVTLIAKNLGPHN